MDTGKNIVFKDGSFFIDDTIADNPEVLPWYFKDASNGLWYYTDEHNHPLKDNEILPLPDSIGYEIVEIPHPNPDLRDDVILGRVVRLKLKLVPEKKETIENGLFNGMTAEQLLEWLDKRCAFNEHQKDYVHMIIIKLIKSKVNQPS